MAALAPPDAAPLRTTASLGVDVAGAESNVAMYLADHGVRTRWVSALGDDPFGDRVLARVASSGVDVSAVRRDPDRPTGLMVKDPAPGGTRVHYYRRGSAAAALGPGLLDTEAVRGSRLLHLSGVTPALSPSCRALAEAALDPARERPYAVSFDVNFRPALWDEPPGGVLLGLAARADIVFVGLDEAQALWGGGLGDAPAVRALLPEPAVLVVKDGGRGATAFLGPEQVTVPALDAEVVEPVGAGDAFAAGFLAGLLRGDDPRRALRGGHLTAVSALRVTGDHGPLLAAPLRERLLAADEAQWSRAVIGGPAGTCG
jgi:2-dehydro-3-deoxygluconokinase